MELNDTQLLQRARVMTKYLNAPDDKKPKLGWAEPDSYGKLSAYQPLFYAKPDWFSRTITYDFDLTAPAFGHNPMRLSDFEVGFHSGWRLLTLDEIKAASGKTFPDDHDIQYLYEKGWITATGVFTDTSAFRTKKPANYWLDLFRRQVPTKKKTRRVPCSAEHFSPGTIIRRPDGAPYEWYAVVGVTEDRMWARAKDTPFHFDSSLTMSYHRSVDGGRTWLPCYVEDEDNEVEDD